MPPDAAALSSPIAAPATTGRQAWAMLVVVIFAWGLSWPVNKAMLASVGPLWATTMRSAVATLTLFTIALLRRRLVWPRRADLPIILNIALLHMAGYSDRVSLGLAEVRAGRSVVLASTTPLWVAPGAALFLGERLTRRRLLGVMLGLVGLAVLFNPLDFRWSDRGAVLG